MHTNEEKYKYMSPVVPDFVPTCIPYDIHLEHLLEKDSIFFPQVKCSKCIGRDVLRVCASRCSNPTVRTSQALAPTLRT